MGDLGALPRWDMTTVFPGLESEEFAAALAGVKADIRSLADLFDARAIRPGGPAAAGAPAVFDEALGRINRLFRDLQLVRTYIHCFIATDASHDTAQALQAELRAARVTLDQLWTRFNGWVGSLDADALLAASAAAREHEFFVRRARVVAEHQMPEGEENLAAELQPPGLSGWARLHSDM